MRSAYRIAALLACVAAGQTPVEQVVPGRPHEVEIRGDDPVLPAHGAARELRYAADFSGTLYVWASGADLDPFLRVEGDAGRLLGEDDDSGGGKTACLALDVEPGQALRLLLASSKPGGSGRAELHLIAAPESVATRAAAEGAKASIARIQELRAKKDVSAARSAVASLVDQLLALEGGADSARIAAALADAGVEAARSGDLERAEAALEQRCRQAERCLPPEHRDLQKARVNLALVVYRSGRLSEARALLEPALAVLTRTVSQDDPELLRTRQLLGSTLYAQGEFAAARGIQSATLELLEGARPDEDADLMSARSVLATTLRSLGELARARELQEHVLEVRARTLPDEHPDLQRIRANLALTLAAIGDLAAARDMQEHVLGIHARTLSPESPELQVSRVNLATTLQTQGDLLGARALLEPALEILERTLPEDSPDLQRTRGNLAVTLYTLGDTARARDLQQKSLQMLLRTLPPDHVEIQRARGNLAVTLAVEGDLDGSRRLREAALESCARALPDDHPELQSARTNLAVTLQRAGEHARALELKRKVVEVYAASAPADDPSLQTARENLASALLLAGESAAALELEQQVLAARARILPDDHPDLQRSRAGLAWVLAASGRWPEARELGLRIASSLRRSLRDDLASLAPREAEERAGRDAQRTSDVLSLALGGGEIGPDPRLLAEVFTWIEMQRGAALTSARLLDATRSTAGLDALRAAVRTESERVARQAAGGTSAELAEAVGRRDRSQRELAAALRAATGDSGLLRDPDVAALERTLRPGEAAIGFWTYSRPAIDHSLDHVGEPALPRLAAFVLVDDRPLACVDLGPIGPIEAAVGARREAAQKGIDRGVSADSTGAATVRELGVRLRELVFDPLKPILGDARVVTVALDDVLHLVPLDALPLDDACVGDTCAIHVRATLWELALPEPRGAGAPALLALGGIDYESAEVERAPDGTPAPEPVAVADASGGAPASVVREGALGRGFSPLPETGPEVERIRELFAEAFGKDGAATLLKSGRATRDNLFARTPDARFVHLATHGYFAPESVAPGERASIVDDRAGISTAARDERVQGISPMVLCGLALAGANGAADVFGRIPGTITAEELSALDLSECELAVLSACDTNVGVRRAGQGVASLQKALHLAGARSVISSLWRVPDEPTRELMVDFYRRLWIEKKSKSAALWEAKRRLRTMLDENGRPKYAPSDWAGWVLTGDPD